MRILVKQSSMVLFQQKKVQTQSIYICLLVFHSIAVLNLVQNLAIESELQFSGKIHFLNVPYYFENTFSIKQIKLFACVSVYILQNHTLYCFNSP